MPPEGLGEVELPFPIAEETIAFEVAGDSMLPKYENGDIIVVYREQRHPLTSFYGEEAAVRLKTGERYLKTIERGKTGHVVNLTSFNAKPIIGRQAGMDRGNLRHPAQGPDRAAAGQGRGAVAAEADRRGKPGRQGRRGSDRHRAVRRTGPGIDISHRRRHRLPAMTTISDFQNFDLTYF